MNYDFLQPIQVRLACTRELVDEDSVKFEDIAEDMEGRDILTFTCPKCRELHQSFRLG